MVLNVRCTHLCDPALRKCWSRTCEGFWGGGKNQNPAPQVKWTLFTSSWPVNKHPLFSLFIVFQNKEKERMKEGKDKDARYTNGHLFTSITVSGMTMCYACNKSITAKEALICPSE